MAPPPPPPNATIANGTTGAKGKGKGKGGGLLAGVPFSIRTPPPTQQQQTASTMSVAERRAQRERLLKEMEGAKGVDFSNVGKKVRK